MPKKIRELRSQLRKAGFHSRPGKGSHEKWYHPEKLVRKVIRQSEEEAT
jgi:predicted RNA binding protein YcfA (HicA-like mRNA interferase family)